jgi:hypothetical protein
MEFRRGVPLKGLLKTVPWIHSVGGIAPEGIPWLRSPGVPQEGVPWRGPLEEAPICGPL